MKELTTKELTLLGKDLKIAKILVLHKHGFSNKEIATLMELNESTVRSLIHTAEKSNK